MHVKFPIPPPVGLEVEINGQRFDLVDHQPHTKLDGSPTTLLVWQGECTTCGEGFLTKSPFHSLPGGRRCDLHKQPGRKVKPAFVDVPHP